MDAREDLQACDALSRARNVWLWSRAAGIFIWDDYLIQLQLFLLLLFAV